MNNTLDKFQLKVVHSTNNLRIIAGAGTGKTTTILHKINYLINNSQIDQKDILLISFTNATVNDIKNKINYDIDVLTFHKLAMKILSNYEYSLISNNTLNYIIYEYLINISKKEKRIILKYFNYNESYKSFLNTNNFNNLIIKFINLYRSNNYSINNIVNIKYNKKEKVIIEIIYKIYSIYTNEKKSTSSLDLDDLITEATNNIKNTNIFYKYIFIDEFQDTSYKRFNLILELVKKCNSKLIIVGDDWQSIYKFSGCDLNIFLNINNYIKMDTLYLEKNYRNSNQLLQISKIFIERNKYQIKKNLHSNNSISNPIIFVPYTNSSKSLKTILDKISTKNILILSRNNNDIYSYLDKDIIYNKNELIYKNNTYKYMTIHKSKGLEADIVILLNCNDDIRGFPNKIEDSPIINKTFNTRDLLYQEERRLMYVALTRSKSYIYILYNINTPSIFIKELKKINSKIHM